MQVGLERRYHALLREDGAVGDLSQQQLHDDGELVHSFSACMRACEIGVNLCTLFCRT